MGLSQSANRSDWLQGGTTSPACATTDGGSGNGGTGDFQVATGGDSIGGDGGAGNDASGGFGAPGASACETTGSLLTITVRSQ